MHQSIRTLSDQQTSAQRVLNLHRRRSERGAILTDVNNSASALCSPAGKRYSRKIDDRQIRLNTPREALALCGGLG